MNREKLYYHDNHLTTFTATVFECRREEDGRYAIGLDRTAFYPEGGGQPSDVGFINDIPVLHVAKGEEYPVHYTESPLEPGSDVVCKVDWEHRFDYMQQHTGQHVLSGVFMKEGEWATLSVHQGEEYTSIEIDTAEISELELYQVEREANRIITENLPVETFWVDESELDQYPLRRPPKVSGTIRLVRIGDGADCVACGGVHTSTTGDIGLIIYLGQEKIRGRVRTLWKIGERAFRQIRQDREILGDLGVKYAVPSSELPARLESVDREIFEKEGEIRQLKEELLKGSLISLKNQIDESGILTAVVSTGDKKFLQNAAQALLEEEKCHFFVLVNELDGDLQWIIGAGEEGSFDFGRARNDILPLINGKGGGRGPIWQGKGEGPAVEAFLTALRKSYGE
ncbi:MAG: alanine--tRNA ligase-related protein [Spirochaetales bacterium]|nr:alanine--tRNA ligase-related protein [Spirochaetales bacterium]